MEIGRFAFLRMHGSLDGKVMLEDELQRIYDSEINVRISWLWDGGIDVRLGDEMNGYLAEENVSSTGDIVPGFKSRSRTSTLIPRTRKPWTRRPESAQRAGCSGRPPVALKCDARNAPRHMQLRPEWRRYSRLFARIAERVWKYRGLSRCERGVDGNALLRDNPKWHRPLKSTPGGSG
jgi:hypothetical protein